ncbi:MAG: TolC family protein [Deltaproteobacteria bacterium]|nr:TolC family protein [Deltaproteobacteria bacterium]
MKWVSRFILLFILIIPLKAEAENPIKKGERLDIQRCIELAIRNHPVINAARNTVKVNESRIGQARSNYYPQLNWQTGYSRISPAISGTTRSSGTTSSSGSSTYDQYASNLNLTQNLYDFEKTATQVQIQNLNTDSSRQDLNTTEAQIILGVKQSYYSLVQAEKNREVARESVKQFQLHLEQAKGFFEVGVKPKFDVTKAEVDLSNAKLNLIRAENAFRIARVNLNNAIGVPDAPEYSLDNTLLFEKYEVDLQEALKKAYNARPDLRSLMMKMEAGSQSMELAKKGYYPYVTGNASLGFEGQDFPLEKGWNVGATLNIPLFSGFQTKSQVAEAKAILDVLKDNEQSLRMQIRLEVEQAYSNLLEATEGIATAQLTVRQAEENFDLANGRYTAGVGNPIEVTDALVALSNAKTTHIAALTGFKTAQASLEKAMGVK